MKKIYFLIATFMMGMTISFTSCGDDGNGNDNDSEQAYDVDYSSANEKNWGNYMVAVAKLLKQDASELYDYWNSSYEGGASYATRFKTHDGSYYQSSTECIVQIIEGCADIANEVGETKIGEPVALYNDGKLQDALYAVESWYSWHSREDYSNNIISIRNAFYGNRFTGEDASDIANSAYNYTEVSPQSICALLANNKPEINTELQKRIKDAITAIMAIPSPFRNNIYCTESLEAQEACADLEDYLTNTVKPYFNNASLSDETLDPIIAQYVDAVVLPTYKELKELNEKLYNQVYAFQQNPSNTGFASCATAWLNARRPWETSEAFLFGPVDAKGLDPNMDSWPLDQVQIYQVLTSATWDTDMNWDEDEDEDDIANHQSVRGFHTLEYLIFKDGKARTIK